MKKCGKQIVYSMLINKYSYCDIIYKENYSISLCEKTNENPYFRKGGNLIGGYMAKNKKKERKAAEVRAYTPFTVLSLIAALAAFAIVAIYMRNIGNGDGFKIVLLLAAAYVCLFAFIRAVHFLYSRHKFEKQQALKQIKRTKDFPLGVLASLYQPAALCEPNGKIVWLNKSFSHHTGKNVILGDDTFITEYVDLKGGYFLPETPTYAENGEQNGVVRPMDFEMPKLLERLKDSEFSIEADGTKSFGDKWSIRAYGHSSRDNEYYILIFEQTTEFHRQIGLYNDALTHIAYIAIDNLAELAQSEPESYRIASTRVDTAIKEWASENEVFIKEYEREKYVMLMTDKSAVEIEKKRYEILERVSHVKIGADKLSVTVSLGVSQKNGSLIDKDKQAQSALESALQRGGNQAVVIGEDGAPHFYGAKALTSLRRSGVRHRVFADKLMRRINECSNVIIMGHRNPDFDAIGSCLGLARLAMSVGKRTHIIANPQSPTLKECFERLEDIPEYKNLFVDAVQAQEMLTSNTLVICSDVNNPDNIEAPDVVRNADYLFMIDHHRQSEKTPEPIPEKCEILIVPSASSASELVSEILELELPYGCKLSREEADIMFAGIMLDTKNFTRNAQVPTFGAAIYLRSAGADPGKAQALFKIDLEEFKQESGFTNALEIYRDFTVIAKEDGADASPAKRIAAAKTADRLLNVKKMRASFVVTRMANDVFISARSDGSVNVQLIMESLKGGGHYNAAATMIKDTTVETATKRLKDSIDAYFGDKK